MAKDQGGPLGKRTGQPHHPKGWHPERRTPDHGAAERGQRGKPPKYGTHDRSEKDK